MALSFPSVFSVISVANSSVDLVNVSIGTQKWGATHPTEHLSPLCIPIPEEAPISFSEKETVNPYHPDLGIFNRAQFFRPGLTIDSVSASFHLEKIFLRSKTRQNIREATEISLASRC